MNNIQELIKWIEDQKTECQEEFLNGKGDAEIEIMYVGMNLAFGFTLDKLKLLLTAETQTTVKKPEA